jgi:hypothetical protein
MITTEEADVLMLEASRPGYGAIEDAEQRGGRIFYFFESGRVGIVDLTTKAVEITAVSPR